MNDCSGYGEEVDFAFDRTRHFRGGNLRKTIDLKSDPAVKVMVLAADHVATVEGPGLLWLSPDAAPDGEWILLGEQAGQTYAAVAVARVPPEPAPVRMRTLAPLLNPEELSLAIHAVGIARWQEATTYCSRCAEYLYSSQAGHLLTCPNCGTDHFPRTDPAVIMLVTDQADRVLLARNPGWPPKAFSTLAGFVEPGEGLEDAVRREVAEEVGVVIGEVNYRASQPWPFPQSLMVGFWAEAQTTDFTLDPVEIAEAAWFSRDELFAACKSEAIMLPPPRFSISRWLVEDWYGEPLPGGWFVR